MKNLFLAMLLLLASTTLLAQESISLSDSTTASTPVTTATPRTIMVDRWSIGIGMGQLYGGLGGNVTIYTNRHLGFFAGVGSAFVGLGYNVGLKYRFVKEAPKSPVFPYITGMYGYNAVVNVGETSKEYNKIFYGPSFGAGIELHSSSGKKRYWSFALIIPVRSSEVNDYIQELEDMGAVFNNELLPVTFSVGIHF